jgi:hypothetical protein
MSDEEREAALKKDLVGGLRAAREESRRSPEEPLEPEPYPVRDLAAKPLPPLETGDFELAPTSPAREALNRLWNVSPEAPPGVLARAIRRLVGFALGPLAERQTEMNSAQVRFDNEIVSYVDSRLDRMSRHYDRVLGLHGRRMEEIDERHLILQQELVRHVHDLVARIELTFEAAEQNHLYLEGMLRETREELSKIAARLVALEKENE